MELQLDPDKVEHFERQLPVLAPWMHPYKFGESLYVGYYKYQGLREGLTFVGSSSSKADIDAMRTAYHSIDHRLWTEFMHKVLGFIDPTTRNDMSLLDISSATGRVSILATDLGFERIISSEIRTNQCNQQRLIYESLSNEKYRRRISVINDPVSADDPDFPAKYKCENIDIVLSFGLLYHLANPFQHLVNLREITQKYAIVYTMTHFNMFAENSWKLTIENPQWITKAVSSVSWTPHYKEVVRVCKKAGFKSVQIVYPDMFEKHFPCYASYSIPKYLIHTLMNRALGARLGPYKNQNFEYFKNADLNPNYFAYVLEV